MGEEVREYRRAATIKPRRITAYPMPKLSLRDLFAVVTIVALALGWWVDHRRQSRLQIENEYLRMQVEVLTSAMKQHGLTVTAAMKTRQPTKANRP